MELGHLPIDFPCHEPLAQQFHAVNLRSYVAPAVVSTSASPEHAAKVFRGAQCFVASRGTGSDSLPRLCVLTGRDDGMGASLSNGLVALASVLGATSSNSADQ